jgi:competence protein ComEC
MRLNILAFAAGVLCLQGLAQLPDWRGWVLGGLVLLLAGRHAPRWFGRGLAIAGCFALGLAWAGWRADLRLADQLPQAWEGQDVEVIGVIASLPQDFSHGTRFEFDVKTGSTAGVVPQRIMLSWYQGRRDEEQFERQPVRPGERWQFTVRLKRPHGNANPGGFDYEAWLLERNIRATGYIRAAPARRLDDMVWQPSYVVERLRHAVRTSFARNVPEAVYPWSGVLVALAVGDQKAINGNLWATFNRTGTTHLMSICYLLKRKLV